MVHIVNPIQNGVYILVEVSIWILTIYKSHLQIYVREVWWENKTYPE